MKHLIKGVVLVFVGLVFVFGGLLNPRSTSAALIYNTEDTVYDDSNYRYWITNLPLFEGTYAEKENYVQDLNDANWNGRNDWHIATESELLWNNGYALAAIGAAFEPTDYSIDGLGYDWTWWSGMYDQVRVAGTHTLLEIMNSELGYWGLNGPVDVSDEYSDFLGAWVTTNVVPVPPAIYLLGSGLVGLVALRRKFQKP